MNEAHNDWDTKLDTILFAYRVSKHRSTGYSPFFMMFHREARLPIEADVEQNETVTSEDIDTETTADAFIEKMLKRQEDIKSIAGENIKKSQKSKRSAITVKTKLVMFTNNCWCNPCPMAHHFGCSDRHHFFIHHYLLVKFLGEVHYNCALGPCSM